MTKKLFALKEEAGVTQLSFYGPIAEKWFEDEKCFDEAVVAKEFANIDKSKPLDIYINSPGGSVSSALAINGILSTHKAGITIHVTGLAASAATLITSLKNAKTVISKGSLFMIHNPLCGAYGNKDDLQKNIEILEKCAESMRSIYVDKTGLKDEEIKKLMDEETWLTAEEAVEYGFADELDESEQVSAYMKDDHILAIAGKEWDLSNLRKPSEKMLMSKKIEDLKPAIAKAEEAVVDPKAEVQNKVEALTIESLNKNHPELVAQIVAEAVKAERVRIQSLAEIDNGTNHDLVVKAMFEEPKSAEQVAIETIKMQKAQAESQAQALAEDAKAVAENVSGIENAEGALPEGKEETERVSIRDAVLAQLKKLNGYN